MHWIEEVSILQGRQHHILALQRAPCSDPYIVPRSLGCGSGYEIRSSLVMVSTSQNHRISSIIILGNNINASKSKKTHRHVPSASKAYTRNLSFRQTCVSGQHGYTAMLWLWLLLEAKRNHTLSACVLTTRLHRQYYKEGRQQTSPDISNVYYLVNPFCIRVTFPSFEPNLCQIPADLQPFPVQEHKHMIAQRLFVRLQLDFESVAPEGKGVTP